MFFPFFFMNEHKNLTHVVIRKLGKLVHKQNCSYDFLFIFLNYNIIIVQIRCINIETKEVVPIGYNRFLGIHHITYAEKEIRYIQYGSLLLFHLLLTDFVCLYNYEFGLSLCKIVRSSVILLLPLFISTVSYA